MTASAAPTAFTAPYALQLAHQAAAAAGLAHDRVELIRLGSNATVRLPGSVVARVARGQSWAEASEREVRVAAALVEAGVPCVEPWPIRQPVTVAGHPVTFWAEIPGPLEQPSIAELGSALRQLHRMNLDLDLPPLDPWTQTPDRVEQAPINDAERRVLRNVLAEVQDAWAAGSAEFELGTGVIHGDAHLGNLARGAGHRRAVLIDFDSACIGPREWDLAPTGLAATSLGWIDPVEYQSFVEAYGGVDVTAMPAWPLLRRMRELRITAWIAMHAVESDELAAEVSHRIACLADPDLPRHWSPL